VKFCQIVFERAYSAQSWPAKCSKISDVEIFGILQGK